MPDLPDLTALTARGQEIATRGQELVTRAVDAVVDVIPTADELLTLSQDVQNKVLSALKWNA